MSKNPEPKKSSSKKRNPLRTVLDELVVPVFEELAVDHEQEPDPIRMIDEGEELVLRGVLDGVQIVHVRPIAVDHERTILRFSLVAGMFMGDTGLHTMLMGTLLEDTFFHVQIGMELGHLGQMQIGCDLVVRADDEPLVRQRVEELLHVGNSLEWFFPLRWPQRLRWTDLRVMEIEWEDLPHGDLEEFFDEALEAPPAERTPFTLLQVAHGLGRWKDLLRLLREHADVFPAKEVAPLKALACRQMKRWLPAIEAAEAGSLKNGRYEGGPWLSPSFMHSYIEAGKDIEALSLLGQPEDGEPAFYDWLRGLALHRAGDQGGAEAAFARYFDRWPGDIVGLGVTRELCGE